ncbi:hypothetical protein LAZ67_14001088 [Cordylochernes scorpioides]|uniref:Transposase n=1 Tax=Cordylochernes scorpioides TaxID=51811 RepID=A0ABY6LAR2_9ARAC|nr:hypothetical protein LAZ67_14001088 [Cordylochernes scorpioides]
MFDYQIQNYIGKNSKKQRPRIWPSHSASKTPLWQIVKIPLDPVWISWNKVRPGLTRAISPKPWSPGGRFSVCQSWCCGFVTNPRPLVAATIWPSHSASKTPLWQIVKIPLDPVWISWNKVRLGLTRAISPKPWSPGGRFSGCQSWCCGFVTNPRPLVAATIWPSHSASKTPLWQIVKIPLDPVWISWNKVRPGLTRAISPKPWSPGGRFSVCQSWCCGFVTNPRPLVAATIWPSHSASKTPLWQIVKIPLDPVWISWNKVRLGLTRAISPKPWSPGGRFSVCQSWCCGFVTNPRPLVAATAHNEEKEVKRKVISLETKIEILDRLRKGDRVHVNEATIKTIRTNENTIRKSVAAGNTTSMGTTSYTRNIAMEKMEQALMLWIVDQTQKKRVPIDTGAITNKALPIYEKIVEQLPSSSSTEKKPIFLAKLKLKGELASGDVDAAQEYPANFAEIINDNSYTPDQVFNADESGFFWKKKCLKGLMSQIFINRLVVIAAKDRITHIAELMADKELSEDDLVNLVCQSESDKSDEEELVPVTFTAKVIREGLALGRKLGNRFMQNDTNVERALRFQCDINHCLAQYEEKLLITDFITISHNVNISASNIESAQITSSDESQFEPSIPKKRMRVISDSDQG